MRLFLQINIGDWKEQGYVKPMLSFASSQADDIIGTDLDNESDADVVELIKKLIEQSQGIFLLVYSHHNPQLPLNRILSLINELFNHRQKIHLAVLSGEHTALEKLLNILEDKFIKNSSDELIRKMIKQYALG